MAEFKSDQDAQQEATAYEEMRIPCKAPSTLRIRPVAEAQVNTNSYRIKFTGVTVHRYEAKFFAKSERFGAKNIAEGLKNDVATEQRRILLSALFKQLLTSKPEIFGKEYMQYLFDGGQTIFSKDRLVLTADAVQKIPLDKEALNEKPRGYLPRRLSDLYVELKYVEEVRVDSMRLAQDELSDDRSALSFIEMIFNQKIVSSDQFHVFRQVCYEKEKTDGRPVEIEARIIKDGLSKGVRLGGSDPNEPQAMLQSSVKAGAFYPEISLKAYLLKLLQCRDERDLERALQDRRRFQMIKKDLKKLILKTTHLASNRMFICDGVDDKPIREVIFAQEVRDADGNVIKSKRLAVVDYMEEKYRLRISCDGCPGIIQKTKDREGKKTMNFYPIDVLTILGGQRLPLQKMDGKFQEQMIKVARMDPKGMQDTIAKMNKNAFLTASNPYARKFGFQMDTDSVKTTAEVLHPPALLFRDRVTEEPDHNGRLQWRPPQNRRYLVSGESKRWMLINYYRSVDTNVLDEFVRQFVRNLESRGTRIDGRPAVSTESNFDKIKTMALQDKVSFLVIVTKDKMDPIHNAMKHFEIDSRIVTQHLWCQTVFNIVRKNQRITLENVCMKTNEKLGGTNFTIQTSRNFGNANSNLPKDVLQKDWIGGRLFMGIDLSHGGPPQGGSASSLPSVVGICYNYNEQLSMNGIYFYQTARETIVQKLEKAVGQAIVDYKNRSLQKKWPTHIVIYRAGVSDAEFRHITALEKLYIKKAIDTVSSMNTDFRPIGFTIVVCQKNNTRIFSTEQPRPGPNGRISDADKNVRPGTLVCKDIVSPKMEQFVLVAQRGIIGTARPTVYTVVADEHPQKKRMESKELQNLTFALCHLHCAVLGTVSVPAFLYHAGAVAKRGRNNLCFDVHGGVDDASTNTSGSRQEQRDTEQEAAYAVELSKKLTSKLNIKYWS
ncbi:hypothetical protein M3Y94_01188600 [Aphelenchoides besseyi]|nr:hypothetical protein M3Y94_01188600 [Aphelenchoides besseyi]KAI6228318.1 hypothetical protein M3Y95_00609900 [Aphelenchoides besseyi]